MLQKRKTPLNQLFDEREGIRIYQVKNSNMIAISQFKIGQEVQIGKDTYTYMGQRTVKRSGIKKSVYFFSNGPDKSIEYNVTNPPKFMTDGKTIKKL